MAKTRKAKQSKISPKGVVMASDSIFSGILSYKRFAKTRGCQTDNLRKKGVSKVASINSLNRRRKRRELRIAGFSREYIETFNESLECIAVEVNG